MTRCGNERCADRKPMCRQPVAPKRFAVASVLVLAAPVWAASTSAAVGVTRHAGACDAHRARAARVTRQMIVWGKPTGIDPDSGGQLTTLYACLRPAGASRAIGRNAAAGPEYRGNVATADLSIEGARVSDHLTTGLASQEACFKYEPDNPRCPSAATTTVQVFNLKSGSSLRQPLPGGAVTSAFSWAGAIAWEAPTEPGTAGSSLTLQAVRFDPSTLKKRPVATLDTGALGSVLNITGLTVHWTNAEQPKSLTVANTS